MKAGKISLLILLAGAFTNVFAQDTFTRKVKEFDEIEISHGIEVLLFKSNSNELEISIKGLDREDVITEVSYGELEIRLRNKSLWDDDRDRHWDVEIKVPYQHLDKVDVSMGASVVSEGPIKADNFEINASMGAVADIELDVKDLELDAGMGSEVTLRGRAVEQHVSLGMGAVYTGQKLETEYTSISVSMGAVANVLTRSELSAKAGMGGVITVSGNPKKWHGSASFGGTISKSH